MANTQTPNLLVATFQRLCYEHLKPQEIERLALSLKRFERSRDVVEIAETMVAILDTAEKSSALFPVVKELIPASCRQSYEETLQRKLSGEDDMQPQRNMNSGISVLECQENSAVTNPIDAYNTISLQKGIHLDRSPKDGANLGFRICYSDVVGPGFFINSLEEGFAEWSGLEVGDRLVQVNSIPIHDWRMSGDQLLKVVVGHRQHTAGVDIHIERLMFNPEKLTAGGSCLVQEVCWYDIAEMTFHKKHKPKWPSQLRHTRMKMQDSTTGRMGLNIRGGREFICGVYISKIEREGLAERCGLRVGDQILTVNGVSMIEVPYRLACRHMAYEDTLDIVVRYTGQFPVYTETVKYIATDITEDRNFLHGTSVHGPMGLPHPYTNGRVDPIGSCSPGTIRSYEESSLSNDKKRFHTGTPSIQNPLSSDESPLLNFLPDAPSPVKTENNQSNTPEVDWSEVTPKPPPRTGKPDLEKLNELLTRRNETSTKLHQPSVTSQEDAGSQSSIGKVVTTATVHQPSDDVPKSEIFDGDLLKPIEQRELESKAPRISQEYAGPHSSNVKMETTAFVHQPAADDLPKHETFDRDILKPVDHRNLNSKPPRNRTKNVEMNVHEEKSKPESKTEKKIITKPEQGHITEPTYTDREKIDSGAKNIEHAKPEPVTESEYTDMPSIVIEPEIVTKQESVVESERNDSEPFTEIKPINKPVNILKAGCSVELELLSLHAAESPMHEDDDRLSYVSSVSLEYDGDYFTMKSRLLEDEDDTEDEAPIDKNSVMYRVRQLEGKNPLPKQKKANRSRRATEPVSLLPENLSEPPKVVVQSVTTTPAAMTPSPSQSPIPSSQNTMERGNYTKPKRRSEDGRFPNAVTRTMNNMASSREENAENNPFQMLQKMASFILNREEIKSIMQYVADYMERNDVEQLVSRLLEVLNNPEKHLLLNQIRELVSPFDRGRFDSMLSVHENINFQNPDYRERHSDKVERGGRTSLKEEQSILARVQCRRKQLDAQMELLEHLRKAKPKIYKHREEDMNLITVYVSKNVRTLGISVTGGADCKKQQALIIEDVHSGGAASETKRIKPGMMLVSVDDEDIETENHKAAVYTIRKAFTDRKRPYMKLVLRKPGDAERWASS